MYIHTYVCIYDQINHKYMTKTAVCRLASRTPIHGFRRLLSATTPLYCGFQMQRFALKVFRGTKYISFRLQRAPIHNTFGVIFFIYSSILSDKRLWVGPRIDFFSPRETSAPESITG